MASQKVKFIGDYNHKWPSRARTAYKAGMTLLVKQEVADAAIAAEKAIAVGNKKTESTPDETNGKTEAK